jgi:hypothetical protein
MRERLTVTTPGASTVDPVSGNERPGAPDVQTGVRAGLWQKSTADVGSATELRSTQDTDLSTWTVIVPLGTNLTAKSEFVNEATGERFRVSSRVARRPDHRPQFLAATARLISDMQ